MKKTTLHLLRIIRLALTLGAGIAVLHAQEPPPKAVPVEDEEVRTPLPAPQLTVPKVIVVPDLNREVVDPRSAPEAPKAVLPRPAPPKSRPKSPEDDLFDLCEMIFQKAGPKPETQHFFQLALQQYSEYMKAYPTGKYREDVQFKMAECYYQSDQWDFALQEFDLYIKNFPSGKNRHIVYYHVGESYYKSGRRLPADQAEIRNESARQAYRLSIQTKNVGAYATYAAFRLGTFAFNAGQNGVNEQYYKEASQWFTLAAAQAPKDQQNIKATVLFFLGRSYRYQEMPKEATAAFTDVTKIRDKNEWYDRAWLELAQMDIEAGRNEEAMKKFEQVAKETAEAEMRGDSLVNAGMIHADAGRTEEALAKFEEVLKIPGDKLKGPRARARFGTVWSAYKKENFDKVVEAWRGLQSEDYADLDESSRARLWLIVGTAYSALNKHAPAAQTLRLLENLVDSPQKQVLDACLEGGYKRIVSLFKLTDPQTPDVIENFVGTWKMRTPASDFIDKAWFVRGAWFFNRGAWDLAAKAYDEIRPANLSPEKAITMLYQKGCAQASDGDKEAVNTLSEFLEKNVSDERAPHAQYQRGRARLKSEDLTNALKDFDEAAIRAKGTDTGESASYNSARVRGMKLDYPGMVAGFSAFLKEYPKTRALPEAQYWIGVGSYQLQKYVECLEPLRTARSLDAKAYFQDSSLMIIGALAAKKDIDSLIVEVDAYLKSGSEKKIGPDILRWLGLTVFRDRKDYTRTARYLTQVVNIETPEKTEPEVWMAWGEALLEIKDFVGAVRALDNHLKVDQRPLNRSKSYLLRGRAFVGANDFDSASKSIDEGLKIDRESLIAAQLHILSGDIAVAAGRLNEAMSSYVTVKAAWEDSMVLPTAISRMIAILEKKGDPESKKEAETLRQTMKKRFPNFVASR